MNTTFAFASLSCVLFCAANTAQAASQSSKATKHLTLSVDMGLPGCSIKVANLYNAHLRSAMIANASFWTDTPPVRSRIGDFAINFKCSRTNKESDSVAHTYGATWDSVHGAWRAYNEDRNDRALLFPVSRIYQLKTRNAVGFLRTTDQVTGAEDQRVRFYSFCLFHADEAVCGDGQSMQLNEPSGNYLPYILRVLKSVEFADTAPELRTRDQPYKNDK